MDAMELYKEELLAKAVERGLMEERNPHRIGMMAHEMFPELFERMARDAPLVGTEEFKYISKGVPLGGADGKKLKM